MFHTQVFLELGNQSLVLISRGALRQMCVQGSRLLEVLPCVTQLACSNMEQRDKRSGCSPLHLQSKLRAAFTDLEHLLRPQ